MEPKRSGSIGPFLILLLLIGVGGAAGVGWWLSEQRAKQRPSNERSASTSLKTISSAEADYRFNDRDCNGINDFWTGDLAGLYRLGLIERGVAEADTKPLTPLVPVPIPYRGYYFEALDVDNSTTPPDPYRKDTDRTSGKVHNLERFGFVAYPADPNGGKYYFLINEFNSVFRAVATIPRPSNWFTNTERSTYWSMPQ